METKSGAGYGRLESDAGALMYSGGGGPPKALPTMLSAPSQGRGGGLPTPASHMLSDAPPPPPAPRAEKDKSKKKMAPDASRARMSSAKGSLQLMSSLSSSSLAVPHGRRKPHSPHVTVPMSLLYSVVRVFACSREHELENHDDDTPRDIFIDTVYWNAGELVKGL